MHKWKPITPTVRMTSDLRSKSHKGLFKEINQFKVTKQVGSGSSSIVYSALNKKQNMAIKVIKKSLMKVQGLSYCEINALQRLHHPNIVELHEVINDESSPDLLLVMQYLDGVSLDELTWKPSSEEVWKWSRQLISALYMCHEQAKVAHRDIKPENLKLKGKEKDLVLYDFGVCNSFEGKGEDNDLFVRTKGSYNFFAPEMMARQKDG